MAIRYYDKALVEKISKWVKDPNMKILSPQDSARLYQLKYDENDDKPITLPMISLSRSSDVEIISTSKKSLTYDGGLLNSSPAQSILLNAIPIKLQYQLDIYTKYFEEADEYLRNFIFNFINHPKVTINIPYNGSDVHHDSTVLVESTVSDNSDIPERLIRGQFTRLTLNLTIDDAWMFSVPIKDNYQVSDLDVLIFDETINNIKEN